jgi:predicted DNA repair protein MutK
VVILASGLLALLDDVAALVKVTAASLDDLPAQVSKTTSKVSGIVIDDAAVTPKYVVGLDPKRELAIIWNITKRSLINKLLILAPLALLLGYFAPWIITPLLMLGGAFLCFEGYEKVHSIFSGHGDKNPEGGDIQEISPEELERIRTNSAVRTDFILSAEIVAITYSTVVGMPLPSQIAVLFAIGVGITLAVYGFVGLLVKADDFGVWLARKRNGNLTRTVGRGIVKTMPVVLKVLSYIGTAAMLWVGAGIIVHGVPVFEDWLHSLDHALHLTGNLSLVVQFLVLMIAGLIFGFLINLLVMPVVSLAKRMV